MRPVPTQPIVYFVRSFSAITLSFLHNYIKLKSFIDHHNNFESFSSTKVKIILDKIIENEKLHSDTFKTLLANEFKEK